MAGVGVEKRGSAATVRACDLCRKRKRRCIWTSGLDGCTNCVNLKETCTTTHVRKPRSKPQKGNRILEYESRIHRLESLLQDRSRAQPQVHQPPLQPADPSVSPATWVDTLRDEYISMPPLETSKFRLWDTLPSDLPRLESVVNPSDSSALNSVEHDTNPENLYILPISSIEPSVDFQQDAAFLQSAAYEPIDGLAEDTLVPPPLSTTSECDYYLPPPELGTALLTEYLLDCNTAFPLYRPHVIANHLRICYAGETDGSAVSWASAYIIFGLAYALRAMSATATPQDNDMAKYYLARVFHGINHLLCSPPSLGLVQCLIGLSLLMRGTSCGHDRADSHFISTALRIAQSLAYYEGGDSEPDTTRDTEQERRVIWLAFIQDTNSAICSNTPMTHRREDIIAADPDESPADALGSLTAAEGSWRVNIFSLRVNLAVLQAEAIQQVLCITKAQNWTNTDIDAATNMVLTRLQAFYSHEIFQLSPSQLFQLLYRSDIAHTVSLEASYFATVFRLRALLALERNVKINPFSLDALKRLAKAKDLECHVEARRLLSLLPIAPSGDVALYWTHHRVLIAALVTVFAYHINNPAEKAPTRDELRGYNQVLNDLGTMVECAERASMAPARELCLELFLKLETGLRIQWLQGITERSDNITPAVLRGEA